MQSVESQSLSLKPVESEPNAKSPDQSDSMDSPQVKHNRIDVSQQKRGSVLIVDYNQFGSLKKKPAEPQSKTIQKKSAFGSSRSGSGSTTKSNKSRGMIIAKSAFSKPSHKTSSPAMPSPRDASPSSLKFKLGINKILSFSKFKKVIAKSLTHRENAAVALRNSVKRQLAARLKVQDKTSHEFGEKITCMAMSFDGKFMIVSTQALEGSPVNKFKLGLTDTMKTDRNYSSKFSEEGPLLDPIKFDGSQNENLLQKSYDETAPLRGVSSPPIEQIGTTKNKNGPGLWIFEMDRRVPEKLPLGEELTDSELEIKCLTVSRSSKYVVCGWSDAVIRIYDIAKKSQSYAFKDVHKNSITSVVITTDDKYLISGSSKDRAISIHDFQKRSLKYLLKDLHTDWLINIALSPDDLKIIAGFYDGAIKIIDREKREVLQTFNVNREEDKAFTSNMNLIGTMQVTHNGKQVVVGCQDKSIRVFDLEGGKPVHIFDQVHQHRITSLIITPDDRYIVSGSFIGSLNIIDLEKLERIHTYEKAHQGMITCSQITPYSKHIVTGSEEGSLQIISLEQEELNGGIENVHKGGVDTIAISRNNQYIVSGSYDGSIAIHYLESRNFVHCIDKAHDRAIKAIKITSDNKYIFSGSDDRSIKIFEMYTWNLIYTFQSIHEDWVTSLALTTNNKFLISGSRDRSIKVLNIHTRDLIHTFYNAHEAAVNCLAITWDNRFVVSGSEDHSIKVFSLQFKRRTVSYRFEATHNGPVKCLSVTHDNKYIISGSTDKSIKIFYLEKMECLHTIHDAHKDSVNSVVISQDDKYIISASSDKCIHIYDIERRRKLYSFIDAHTEFITSVAISEDNSRIVSGSNDNSIRIFTNPYNMTTLTITEANRILPLSYFGLFIMNTFLEEETPEAKYRIITKYPDLTIYPHGLNLFHIAAIFFPNKELIKFCLESSINFSGDFYGRTPLHYLLNSDKTDFNIVNYLLENFETLIAHSTEPYKAMTDVTQDLPTILTLSPNLVVNLLKSIVVNPLSYKNEELNHFGSIPGGVSRKCVPYKSPIFTPKVRSQLLDEDGNNLLSIKIILLFKDYDPCSPEMLEMLQALEAVDNEIIFRTKAISVLIDYLWGVSKRTLYVLGFLYSTYMGFLSVYAGLREDDRPLWLEIVLIVFGGSFLAYKSFQLASSGIKLYFTDLWNLVEITGGIMMVTTIIATWSSVSDISRQWLMTITLVMGYARWISFFRIIDETRKLIRIIIEILKDMRSFLAIVIIAILGFSIIFYQFDDDTIYSDRLLLTYNLLYAQFDIDDFNASQIFYLIVITILLSVVFLNLLVAIMSSTFQRVQESSLLADSKEKIVLTLETVALKRLFKRLGSFFKRRKDFESLHNLDFLLHTNPLKGYLFFVESSNSYNEEEAGESEWEQRIVAIKKIVRGEMEKENEGVQARIAGMEEHISKHEQKLVGLRKSLGEKLNEIESSVNHVLHLIQQQRK